MGNTKYIGRVGGLAVALGVGIAVATTPGIALADDTASTNSAGNTETAGATGKTPESEGTSTTTGTATGTTGTSDTADSQTDGASRPGLDAVDTSTSGTSASTDASVRQAPPGMVNATGGAQLSRKSSSDTSTGDEAAEVTTDDSTRPKGVADSKPTSPEAPAAAEAPVGVPRASDNSRRPVDRPTGAPRVDVDTVTATAGATPSRPEDTELARTVVDGALDEHAAPSAVTALTGSSPSPPQTTPVARQVISAAPEEPTPPRSEAREIVLGLLASLGPLATGGPLTPVDSPLGLALAAWGSRLRQFGQAVGEEARSLPVSSTLTSQDLDTSIGEQRLATAAMTADTTMMTTAAASAPLPSVTQSAPDHAKGGAVSGSLIADNLDGDLSTTSTYSVTGQPAKGSVTIRPDGAFTYTPTQAARLAADQTQGGDTDTFTVTVQDGLQTTDVAVTVPVSSAKPQTGTTINTAATPSGAAVTPDGKRTYVANQSNGTVSVINTDPASGAAYNTVVKTITVGGQPSGVAISLDGKRAYVSKANGTVAVINTDPASGAAYNTVVKTVTVGGQPSSVAITPDSKRVYVTKTGSSTVSMIDTTNYQVTNVTVGFTPTSMAFAPDGSRAYMTNRTGGTVAVLDTKPGSATYNKVVKTITVGTQPTSVAVTPDGKKAYASNSNGTVSIINTDPSSGPTYNTVTNTIGVGPSPTSVQITHDGSLAYVANSNDTISVIDTKTNTVKSTVTIELVPDQTGGHVIALTSDGRAYVTDAVDNNVRSLLMVHVNTAPQVDGPPTVLSTNETDGSVTGLVNMKPDIDGDKLTFSTAAGSGPASGTVTYDAAAGTYTYTPTQAAREEAAQPDGEKFDRFTVNVSDGQGGITTVPVTVTISPKAATPAPGLSATTTPIGVGADPYAAAVNGNRAYVANISDSTVSVIDTDTNRVVGTIPVGSGPTAVAVKPDGTRVYVANYYEGTVSVIDTNPQSANYNKVIKTIAIPWGETGSVSGVNLLAVSPDDTKVYVSGIDNTVSVIDTATNTISEPYDVAFEISDMAVSPDSSRLYIDDYGIISIRDAKTMQNMGSIYLGGNVNAQDIVVSPNGKRLYALTAVYESYTIHHTVSVIDTDPTSPTYKQVMKTIPVADNADHLALSANGSRAYVTHGSGTITVIDTSTGTVIGTIVEDNDGLTSDSAIVVGPNGRLYVIDSSENTLYVVTVDEGTTAV